MPSVVDNLSFWSHYSWKDRGDEWSEGWGGTDFVWWSVVFPRIMAFVPAGSILELAPGYGRFSQYLKQLCQRLTLVDLTPACIEGCRQRFAADTHITYHVNDGVSLEMIPDNSIDFVFSYDSLVHVEADVIEVYLRQLARKLTARGVGFIHHSNIGALIDPKTGALPFENIHWRAQSMTGQKFRELSEASGLVCVGQEIIDWGGQGPIDCISVFASPTSAYVRSLVTTENTLFASTAAHLQQIAPLYAPQSFPQIEPRDTARLLAPQPPTAALDSGTPMDPSQARIALLEQQRDQIWAELQRVGKSWEQQREYISRLERERGWRAIPAGLGRQIGRIVRRGK